MPTIIRDGKYWKMLFTEQEAERLHAILIDIDRTDFTPKAVDLADSITKQLEEGTN